MPTREVFEIMKNTTFYIATTCVVLLSACGVQGDAEGNVESDSSKVLARVGDIMITEQMINDELSLIPLDQRQSFETPEGRRAILMHVVERKMLLLAAIDLGLESDSFVITQVETAREGALIQTYYQQEVVDAVVIPEEDILAFYNEHTGDLYFREEGAIPLEDVRESIEDILKPEPVNTYLTEVILPNLRDRYQVEIIEDTILPYETMSADSLLRSAQNLMESDPVSAITYFRLFIDRFPDHERAHQAQFLIGFTYSEQMGDYESAEAAFQTMIDNYPDSDFADDAGWMIENMGIPPEEILFEETETAEVSADSYIVSNSDVWYAHDLRQLFPEGVELHGWTYPLDELPCLPVDISSYDIALNYNNNQSVLEIVGTITIEAIPAPFIVYDGAMGEKYLLRFSAFLISPQNEIVWSQDGYPSGEAWVDSKGSTCDFYLVGSYSGSTEDHHVLVVAYGDPIHVPDFWETIVLLGVAETAL